MHSRFWFENLQGGDKSEELDINGKITLEWILGKYRGKMWTGFI